MDEVYYAMNIEELRAKSKTLSLVAKWVEESDGTHHIWSSGSDDEEICHPTHGVMYAKYVGDEIDEKKVREKYESDSEGWHV